MLVYDMSLTYFSIYELVQQKMSLTERRRKIMAIDLNHTKPSTTSENSVGCCACSSKLICRPSQYIFTCFRHVCFGIAGFHRLIRMGAFYCNIEGAF